MPSSSKRRSRGHVAVLTLAGAVALAGCSSQTPMGATSTAADVRPVSSSATPTKATVGPTAGSPKSTVRPASKRPADPLAPATPVVIKRNGKTPHPRFSAVPAPFTGTVAYADKLRLAIVSVSQGTVTGEGPGVFKGDPRTTFTVKVTNGTTTAIQLDAVVVSVSYGSPGRVARPVYGTGAQDFSGLLQPGRSAQATYSFSIPAPGLANSTFRIDFDGTHTAAVFRGRVTR